ncbi:FG-GAP-like repeat-containing protein [Myxococcota bacterium]|nr:FG-GAP-like repeat-containing protein [Myxococcota bacterium]
MHGLLIGMLAGCLLGPQDRAAWDDQWGVQDGGQDLDGDGYGTTDCDDGNDAVFPGAVEICNGIDDDCDGDTDVDTVPMPRWYPDIDEDGYGDDDGVVEACEPPGDGYIEIGGDCADGNAAIHPDAEEVCNGTDDDCDDVVDGAEAEEAVPWYLDADEDTWGDPATLTVSCPPLPDGAVVDGGDCDDNDDAVNPGATEKCNEIDDDCDDEVDEADADDASIWYADVDGDGYGDAAVEIVACDLPDGAAENGDDCDDDDDGVNPGVEEICDDGVDQDCDGGPGACVWSGEVDLGDADAIIVGVEARALEAVVVATPDIDGDGLPDIQVGSQTGWRWYSGTVAGSVESSSAVAILTPSNHTQLSTNSAWADVNGDGEPDLIVGAATETTGNTSGTAWVFPGPITGELDETDAIASITGSATYEYLGESVVTVGDLTGDTIADVVISARLGDRDPAYCGGACVWASGWRLDGASDDCFAWLYGVEEYDYAASSLAAAGDTDGDGIADLLVGAWMSDSSGGAEAGAVYLVNGPVSSMLSLEDADLVLRGESESAHAGIGTLGAGEDLDGDGRPDVIIGSYHDTTEDNTGTAYLVLSPLPMGDNLLSISDARFTGLVGDGWLDGAVAGDLNGDAQLDLALASYGHNMGDEERGGVYLLYDPPHSGVTSVADADAILIGEREGDGAGLYRAAPGDTNGDGFDDLLVGSYGSDRGAEDGGAVYLLRGGGP